MSVKTGCKSKEGCLSLRKCLLEFAGFSPPSPTHTHRLAHGHVLAGVITQGTVQASLSKASTFL